MLDAVGAREAADSVYAFLRRTAERSGEGTSWETLSYRNEPIRRHDLWDGVPGVALFLADYAGVTGSDEAAHLAAEALAWSVAHARSDPPPEPGRELSLGRGAAGLALAHLHLARIFPTALDTAVEQARLVAAKAPSPRDPGLLWGNAGQILALVRVWHATGEQQLLEAAVARGAVLRDLPGALASAAAERPIPLGLAPGLAGVGIGLLALLTATGDDRWKPSVMSVAEALVSRTRAGVGAASGSAWPAHTGPNAPV